MELTRITEFRFAEEKDIPKFLEQAQEIGYRWNSGSTPTGYNPLEYGMDYEKDSIVLYSDNTMMHGPIEGEPVTFKKEIPIQVQVTGRPLTVTIDGRDYMLVPLDGSNREVEGVQANYLTTDDFFVDPRVSAEYMFSNTDDVLKFLKVAEAFGYTWGSGIKPTAYEYKQHVCTRDSISVRVDNTISCGVATNRAVPYYTKRRE